MGVSYAKEMPSMEKKLSLFDLSLIVISLVIGMGIFRVPTSVAASSGTEFIFYGVWIAGGVIALLGALVYAEIGQRMPAIGGYYRLFATCYHPAIGFTVNAIILISNAASMAIIALIGADYVSDLLYGQPSGELFNTLVATASIGIFYTVNLAGLSTSSRVQNLLTLLKLSMMVVLIASVFKGISVAPHGYTTGVPVLSSLDTSPWALFVLSLIPVCFAFGGYQQTINFGGESKKLSGVPLGILIGIGVVNLLYLAINVAYVQVIGYEPMKNATAIGALLCEAWYGTAGAKVFDALMFVSVMAYVNVLLLSNPRVMYAMSKDGVFPAVFSVRNKKTGALTAGLTAFSLTAIFIGFFGKGVDSILNFSMFLDSIGFVLSAVALFILRKRQKDPVVWWGRFTPFIARVYILAYLAVVVGVILKDREAALVGTVLLLLFLGVYFVFYRKKGAQR